MWLWHESIRHRKTYLFGHKKGRSFVCGDREHFLEQKTQGWIEGTCAVCSSSEVFFISTGKTGIVLRLQQEIQLFLQDLPLSTDGMNIMIASRPEIPIYKSPWGPSIITGASFLKKKKEPQVLSCPVPGNSFRSAGGNRSVDQLFADTAPWISLLTGASPGPPSSPATTAENYSLVLYSLFLFYFPEQWGQGSVSTSAREAVVNYMAPSALSSCTPCIDGDQAGQEVQPCVGSWGFSLQVTKMNSS